VQGRCCRPLDARAVFLGMVLVPLALTVRFFQEIRHFLLQITSISEKDRILFASHREH
jgi:uncharacterized membrane protein YqhA